MAHCMQLKNIGQFFHVLPDLEEIAKKKLMIVYSSSEISFLVFLLSAIRTILVKLEKREVLCVKYLSRFTIIQQKLHDSAPL